MYRIFDLLPSGTNLRGLNPCQLNYKTQLTESLIRVDKMTKGRIVEVVLSNYAGDKIVSIDIAYTDDPTNTLYPLRRVTTRRWYDHSGLNHGIEGYDQTTKTKYYSPWHTVKEGQRRRHNIMESLFAMSTKYGMATEASDTMKDQSANIRAYETMGDTAIIDYLANDTTHSWLNVAFPPMPSITFRQALIGGLTV